MAVPDAVILAATRRGLDRADDPVHGRKEGMVGKAEFQNVKTQRREPVETLPKGPGFRFAQDGEELLQEPDLPDGLGVPRSRPEIRQPADL